jgi:hypothetical protein
MGFNLLSDPELAARQSQLNSQWYALNQTLDECSLTASSAPFFSQFYADYDQWKDFFASGSDWSSGSKHATDDWQTKLKDYTQKVNAYCGQSSADAGGAAYIPGIKDNPPDAPGLLDELKGDVAAPFNWISDTATKIGIVAAVVLGALLVAVVWIAVKGNVKAGPSGVSVGK